MRVMMGRISAKSSSCIFLVLYNSFAAGTIQAPSQKISFSPPSLVILDILKDLLCKGYNILSVEFTIFEYTTEFVINPRMPFVKCTLSLQRFSLVFAQSNPFTLTDCHPALLLIEREKGISQAADPILQ